MALQFAICNEVFQSWSLEQALCFIRQTGYDGVEIAPFTLAQRADQITSAQRAMVRQIAADQNLEIVGMHWLLVGPTGLHLTDPNPQIRQATKGYLEELIGLCQDLGGRILVVGSPKQRSLVVGDTYEKAWERTKNLFFDLLPAAEKAGVIFCIEALPGETDFIPSLKEAVRFVKEVNHPCLQTMVDVKSACAESLPLDEAVRLVGPHLRHLHANDANRQGPGMGATDLRPLAQAVKELNYSGFVSVEVFDFSPGPERIAVESLRYLRQVFLGFE
ncbi:MAG: sugar phosphate isomerase/epimerase [Armatimonadetes bacterium]|nr:sugar phosphate isomerase/epimerase [Armatimonadota bacterium]MDW8120856.1 sugar phosphate isomerase/epimerase [Armatimonadota bacterium]